MELQGNFDSSFLATILQHLAGEGRTGILTLTSVTGKVVRVLYQKGAVIYATGSQNKTRLGFILISKGLITNKELFQHLEIARSKECSLGKALTDRKCLSETRFKGIVEKQAKEVLFNLFLWKKGFYSYADKTLDLTGIVIVHINIMQVVMEAAKRIDDMAVFREIITTDEIVFKVSQKIQAAKELVFTSEEWRILSMLDQEHTVSDLVRESGINEFRIYEILCELIKKGIIESEREALWRETPGEEHWQLKRSGKSKTILVVDDMRYIRNILKFNLKNEGYTVKLATNGQEAVAFVAKGHAVDLIIMDIMMPIMDGFEAVKRIRALKNTKDIPIIFLTSKAQKSGVRGALRAGGNDYIIKPYKFEDLNSKVEKLLRPEDEKKSHN